MQDKKTEADPAEINQHPCGRLIADLVDAQQFPCWQAPRSLRTGSLCVVQSSLAPAKRPIAGIGGAIPRPEEALPRAPVPVVPLPWAPERLAPPGVAHALARRRRT
jgi:hypothetical protein